MKNIKVAFLFGGIVLLASCTLLRWRRAEIYPMSYDQTYMVALSALDDMKNWRLSRTDHEEGIIVIESMKYLGPEKEVTFIVKRIEPFRTKVEVYRKHACPSTQKFFKAIDRRVEERALTYPS